MRILDLENLTIRTIKKNQAKQIVLHIETINSMKKSCKLLLEELSATIENNLKSYAFPIEYADITLIWNDKSIEKQDAENCAELFAEWFMSALTTDEPRERENRLSVPLQLRSNKLSRMKLLKLINNKAKIGGFRLCVLINGTKFKIV